MRPVARTSAPIEHAKLMERALKDTGVPAESLYFPNKGHGFYTEPHRRGSLTRVLAFLSRQASGSTAKPVAAVSSGSARMTVWSGNLAR